MENIQFLVLPTLTKNMAESTFNLVAWLYSGSFPQNTPQKKIHVSVGNVDSQRGWEPVSPAAFSFRFFDPIKSFKYLDPLQGERFFFLLSAMHC